MSGRKVVKSPSAPKSSEPSAKVTGEPMTMTQPTTRDESPSVSPFMYQGKQVTMEEAKQLLMQMEKEYQEKLNALNGARELMIKTQDEVLRALQNFTSSKESYYSTIILEQQKIINPPNRQPTQQQPAQSAPQPQQVPVRKPPTSVKPTMKQVEVIEEVEETRDDNLEQEELVDE